METIIPRKGKKAIRHITDGLASSFDYSDEEQMFFDK